MRKSHSDRVSVIETTTRNSEIGAASSESMGRSGSKRKDQSMRRIGYERHTLPRNSRKKLPRIEELRRICCEETDRARQLRIDEMSLQQERNPTTVSQLLTQSQDLRRIFYDPETASNSGTSRVPSQPLNILSPGGMLSRDSGLPLDTRIIMGTSGSVFESLPAREGPSSAFYEN